MRPRSLDVSRQGSGGAAAAKAGRAGKSPQARLASAPADPITPRVQMRFDPPPRELPREAFLARYGGVWEATPWIAEAAFDRGLGPGTDTPEGLAAAMAREVATAPRRARLALLRAHPDLAGRLALAGGLTEASTREQAGAGLDACMPEELAEFRALNARYVERFGFPPTPRGADARCARPVRGPPRTPPRVGAGPEAEFEEALGQVARIARLRLEGLAESRSARRSGR